MLGFERECGTDTLAGFSELSDSGEPLDPVAEFEQADDAMAEAMEAWQAEFGDGSE